VVSMTVPGTEIVMHRSDATGRAAAIRIRTNHSGSLLTL
jgi:hypothetical protein